MEEKDAVFRERAASVDHPLKEKKRQRRNSSDMEERSQIEQVLDELKQLRKEFDELKVSKTEPKAVNDICEMRADIVHVKDLIRDVKTILESVEVKFDKYEKRLEKQEKHSEKQDKRIDNVYSRLDAQSKEIHSLREELRKTKDRVIDTECVVEKTTDSIKESQNKLRKVDEKAIDLSARGRRLNAIFHGIPESAGETKETCKQKVKDFIKEKCNIPEKIDIEVAHRLGAKKPPNIGSAAAKPRPMIAKFYERDTKDIVMRTKNDLPEGYGMTHDFPREIRLGRSRLIPKMIQAKKDKKEAWIAYPCRLFIDGHEVERIDPASLSN